ncbi:MAG: carbamoyltransferase HypF [Methanomassiliicoccales archaeon]|jgi:hydrogenase maturation protein HypF|nr:carbamoyltransferase HypF [Methanomassiliicoccales archaeon]
MRIVIRGIVQGVGFRPTVYRIARAMGLNGFVQNNGSNVIVEVDRDGEIFLEELKRHLPPLARIDSIEIISTNVDASNISPGFRIVPSNEGERGVSIPTDTAICEDCRNEIFDEGSRRYLYPFTNCTICGARFSLISNVPYDRIHTSMYEFPMCKDCREEYEDPTDRRFHHQTISCPKCGPHYYLVDSHGNRIDEEPIRQFAEMLHQGAIGIAKSWGGMHICCTLENLSRLREWYRRKEKPFAVMFRDLKAVKELAEPTPFEEKLLASRNRPIVLVKKKEKRVNDLIAPGLGNIGAFLPYSGMHHILFHYLQENALVMTSANVPGEPMILQDDDVFSMNADCYLLHNRKIINRCDDSVLRTFNTEIFFLRKSRGYIPSSLNFDIRGATVGVGAQENITGAIAYNGRIYPTQYIGDGSSLGVIEFLDSAIKFQKKLLGIEKIDAIGIDMHPGYTTRRLGKELSETWGAPVVEIQHHHAHGVSLLVDRGLDEIIALTLDGTGYGDDGKSWGGEVLYMNPLEYERVGHLQEIPLLGGEKAVRDPRRLVFALCELSDIDTRLFNDEESAIFKKMMRTSPLTTSFGRVLDALSCYFGICCSRTYEGEPAMKLERYLEIGNKEIKFKLERDGNIIKTVSIFKQLVHSSGKREDRIYSFIHTLLEGLVEIAAEEALRRGVKAIGLTGGVSYNYTISAITKRLVEAKGLEFVCHSAVPNGDGGISTGQCAVAAKRVVS